MSNRKLVVFPDSQYPSGTYRFILEIDDGTSNCIVNEYDSEFSAPGYFATNWQAHGSGASVTVDSNTLKIVKGGKLTGSDYLTTMVNGERYRLEVDIIDYSGGTVTITGANDTPIGSTSRVSTAQTFDFLCNGHGSELKFVNTTATYFRIDNVKLFRIENALMVKLGSFKLGSNNGNFPLVLYPGNCTIEIKPVAPARSNPDYDLIKAMEIHSLLCKYDASFEVQKYTAPSTWTTRFKGKVDKGDIGFKNKDRTISMRLLDGLSQLKLNAPTRSGIETLDSLLQLHINDVSLNMIRTIEFVQDILIREDVENNDYGLEELYINGAALSGGEGTPFITRGDVLKAMLLNLASYAVLGFDNKVYIMPFHYNNCGIYNLYYNEVIVEAPAFNKGYDGLKTQYHLGSGSYSESVTYPEESEEPYEIVMPYPLDNIDTETLTLTSDRLPAESLSAKYKTKTGAYSARASLAEHVHSILLPNIKETRALKVAVKSADVPQNCFFQLLKSRTYPQPIDGLIYRARCYEYDLPNNTTIIHLVESKDPVAI